MKTARVVITAGDPAGIGPEVSVKALREVGRIKGAAFFLVGDRRLLGHYGLKKAEHITVVDSERFRQRRFRPGISDQACAAASLDYLNEAVRLIRDGDAQALVTAPVSKESLRQAGFPWPGHTEFLAHAFGVRHVEMVFVTPRLKTVVVTRHMALSEAVRAVTQKRIKACGRLMVELLREKFRVKAPRIAVCGLNPHAGEGGLFGSEEKTVIIPALKALNKCCGPCFEGPFSPDAVFKKAVSGAFDLVIAMYHDQGLIPFKLVGFEAGVHLTAGLPFIRTSPVHGTAFDIAGKNTADPSSMAAAIRLACRLMRR